MALLAAVALTIGKSEHLWREKSLGIVNSFILEMYSGIHKIKAAAAEEECLHQWAERYSRLRKKLFQRKSEFFILHFRHSGLL